eukprot:1158434-Pelagomonas_calceolata.AAC.12
MKGSACACPHAGLEWMLSSSSELTWGVLHAALNGGLPAIDQSQREEVDANCWSSDQGQGHCLIARPGVFDWRLICFRFTRFTMVAYSPRLWLMAAGETSSTSIKN